MPDNLIRALILSGLYTAQIALPSKARGFFLSSALCGCLIIAINEYQSHPVRKGDQWVTQEAHRCPGNDHNVCSSAQSRAHQVLHPCTSHPTGPLHTSGTSAPCCCLALTRHRLLVSTWEPWVSCGQNEVGEPNLIITSPLSSFLIWIYRQQISDTEMSLLPLTVTL